MILPRILRRSLALPAPVVKRPVTRDIAGTGPKPVDFIRRRLPGAFRKAVSKTGTLLLCSQELGSCPSAVGLAEQLRCPSGAAGVACYPVRGLQDPKLCSLFMLS